MKLLHIGWAYNFAVNRYINGWIYWFAYVGSILVLAPLFGLPAAIAVTVVSLAITLSEYSQRWTPDAYILSVLSGVGIMFSAMLTCAVSYQLVGFSGMLFPTKLAILFVPPMVLGAVVLYLPLCTQTMIAMSKRAGYALAFDASQVRYPFQEIERA